MPDGSPSPTYSAVTFPPVIEASSMDFSAAARSFPFPSVANRMFLYSMTAGKSPLMDSGMGLIVMTGHFAFLSTTSATDPMMAFLIPPRPRVLRNMTSNSFEMPTRTSEANPLYTLLLMLTPLERQQESANRRAPKPSVPNSSFPRTYTAVISPPTAFARSELFSMAALSSGLPSTGSRILVNPIPNPLDGARPVSGSWMSCRYEFIRLAIRSIVSDTR